MIARKVSWFCLLSAAAVVSLSTGRADEPKTGKDHKALTKADIDEMMTSLSNWGRWGKDDQRGTLNLITEEKRRQAAALVKQGAVVSLAHRVIKEDTDSSTAFTHRMVLPNPDKEISYASDEYSVSYHGFTQTHLDGLCHLIYKGKMYNGFSLKDLTAKGADKLGVQNFQTGIVTRGVLMDMPRCFGVRFLDGKRAIYPEDLDAWEKKAGVKIESGDAVLIRTGRWTRRETDGPWDVMKDSAGLHASCLPWLKQRDVALIGSDLALDVLPSAVAGFDQPVHWVSIVAMGMPILDNGDFETLSEEANSRKRWQFMLTVAPLVVEGGTGSPINPLATF